MPLTPNKMIFQDLQRLVNNHFGFINGTHKLSLQSEESHLNFHKRTEKSADRPNDRLKTECRKNLFLLISVPLIPVLFPQHCTAHIDHLLYDLEECFQASNLFQRKESTFS